MVKNREIKKIQNANTGGKNADSLKEDIYLSEKNYN